MEKINFPLKDQDGGLEVKNLHDAVIAIAETSGGMDLSALDNTGDFRRSFEQERKEQMFGKATMRVVSFFQQTYMKVVPTGEVDRETASAVNTLLAKHNLIANPVSSYSVKGTIFDQWIEPLENASIRAFQKTMRGESALGSVQAVSKGKYEIIYATERSRASNSNLDIFVKVLSGPGKTLFTSEVYFNAPDELTIDINLGPRPFQGKSEFLQVLSKIKPFIGKLSPGDLKENNTVHDLGFLSSKTGLPLIKLAQIVAAFRYEGLTELKPEIFYGLLSGLKSLIGISGDIDTGLDQAYKDFWTNPLTQMTAAFQVSANTNVITYKLLSHKAAIQRQLQKLKNNPPRLSSGEEISPVYELLKTAGVNPAQQEALIENNITANPPASFWTAMAKKSGFLGQSGKKVLAKLQAIFQLSGWVQNNTALVAYIVKQDKIASSSDFISLAAYSAADWVKIIDRSKTVTESKKAGNGLVTTLAANLAAGVEKLYPTAVFSQRFLKQEKLAGTNTEYISGVLATTDFDILNTNIRAHLKTHIKKNPLPKGADQAAIGFQLMGMQRVYKTVQNADTAIALLSENIQSARQVYQMGKPNFVAHFQDKLGGSVPASAVFEQASQIHAGAAFLTGRMVTSLNNPPAKILPDPASMANNSTFASDYADVASLFGLGSSYCQCKDCNSFLGIPAYFTDLLDFIYQRKTIPGSAIPNARALLLANNYVISGKHWRRRPDLGDIDLSCKNTNRELPYIDIVNELLEDYIIPPFAAFKIPVAGNTQQAIVDYFIGWLFTYFAAGKIYPPLYNLLLKIAADPKTPICNIMLLSQEAVVSDVFFSDNENYPSWIGQTWIPQWIIRDEYITLKIALVIKPESIAEMVSIFGKELITADEDPAIGKPPAAPSATFVAFTNQSFRAKDTSFFGLIVQEIHQTHLKTAEINTNPEYTNTNVYNSLSDPFNTFGNNKWHLYPNRIPLSLPFDLYFTQANMYLEKMGKKRYDLLVSYRDQTEYPPAAAAALAGNSTSVINIAYAYLDLSPGETAVIFTPRPAAQNKFWGPKIAGTAQPEVDLFLTASGLTFKQLQALLKLKFINPAGDSFIADIINLTDRRKIPPTIDDTCDTSKMVITAMTGTKLDHINRFLRLWNKLNTLSSFSMEELDSCIMSAAIGAGSLDDPFAVHLYYFLQIMTKMSASATAALVLYQDIDPSGKNSLYKQLFQNRQLSNPLVAAFNLPLPLAVTKITDPLANPGAIAVILTACGITQIDLTAILAVNNGAFSDLSVTNLSVIYACSLLSNTLSCPVADLLTYINLLGINPLRQILTASAPAIPGYTFDFFKKVAEIQNSAQKKGFTADEMNYLLTNQSTGTPSLTPDSGSVVSGLTDLRSSLQQAISLSTVTADPKGVLFKKWISDPDLNWNGSVSAQVTAILANLGTGSYLPQILGGLRLLQLLQTKYRVATASAYLDRMPLLSFPDASIKSIVFDSTQYFLFHYGTMSLQAKQFLISAAPDAASQAAIQLLFSQSQLSPLSAAVLLAAAPAATPAWISQAQQNMPSFSAGAGALGFKGPMTAAVYSSLLAQSGDAGYRAALGQLLITSQGATPATLTYIQLNQLPSITLPEKNITSLSYEPSAQQLSFTGAMTEADCLALLGLNNDTNFQSAICQLFNGNQSGPTDSSALAALPAPWTAVPDLANLAGVSYSTGQLTFSAQMTATQLQALLALDKSAPYVTAVSAIFNISQAASPASAPLAALPAAVVLPLAGFPALSFSPSALSIPGQLNKDEKNALTNLSGDPGWKTIINTLFGFPASAVSSSVDIAALPPGLAPGAITAFGVTYKNATAIAPAKIAYKGVMTSYVLDQLLALSSDANWAGYVAALFQACQANKVTTVQLPLPAGLAAGSFAAIAGLTPTSTATTLTLSFAGQLPAATLNALLAISQAPAYISAINYLNLQNSAIIGATLPSIDLPLVSGHLSSIAYAPGAIVFMGNPDPDSMDEFNLKLLSPDSLYTNAIGFIYNPPVVGSLVGVALSSLPPITLPSAITGISWMKGELSYTGQLQVSDFSVLQQLSNDASYQAALSSLMVTLAALPPAVTIPILNANSVDCVVNGSGFALGFLGVMSGAVLASLLALSADTLFQAAMYDLYNRSQAVVVQTVTLAALPPITIPTGLGVAYDITTSVLYYQGPLPIPVATIKALTDLSAAEDFSDSVQLLASAAPGPATFLVYAPPPQTAFADAGALSSGNISYQGGKLNFKGPMGFGDFLALVGLSADPLYQSGLNDLFVNSQAIAAATTISSQSYLPLPAVTFPQLYSSQLSYTPLNSTLTIAGYLASADQTVLLSLGNSYSYRQAIMNLFTAISPKAGATVPLFASLYENLLPLSSGVPSIPAASVVYGYFLAQLTPVYQKAKLRDAIAAQLSTTFSISSSVATVLARKIKPLFTSLSGSDFTGNSKPINPDPVQSPQAKWYFILARMALVIGRYQISAADIKWLLKHGVTAGALDLLAYPDPLHPLPFASWEVFNQLRLFQQNFPPVIIPDPAGSASGISLSVYKIISEDLNLVADLAAAAAPNPGKLIDRIVRLTSWNRAELLYLLNISQHSEPGLKLNPLVLADSGIPLGCLADLTDAGILARIADCFAIAARLKVTPSRCVTWVTDPITSTVATDIKQALKSLYPDAGSWTSAIVPLMNTLRQNRRDAAHAYLLSNTIKNPFGQFSVFADDYGIYSNFLIDTEMAACQPTTRLIQGYCSIQLFVQRCLLNVEQPYINASTDPLTGDPEWSQWEFIGTAEKWRRGRHTFLFPENVLIEGALPNQSPLFQAMQNDLTQGPVTTDLVTTAFSNYLEGLDEIAHLHVSGMWYDDATSILHVIGSTIGADPAIYYYRTHDIFGRWSPWEKITADISSGAIIPVMQNGRLYVYWPIFTQASDDDKSSQTVPASNNSKTTTAPAPSKYWKIQLAFSEYLNGKWTGKKVSKDFLVSDTILFPSSTNTQIKSPSLYPDTPDFAFAALDIPKAKAGIFPDTVAALLTNNSISIICYKPLFTANIALTFNNSKTPPGVKSANVQIPLGSPTDLVVLQSLLDQLNASQTDSHGHPWHLSSKEPFSLVSANPAGDILALFAKVHPPDSWKLIEVTVTFSQVDGFNRSATIQQGPNSFFLDPARGYPSAVVSNIPISPASITDYDFPGSTLANMLSVGQLPLSSYSGKHILNASSLKYQNIENWQMGLLAKFNYLFNGSVVDSSLLGAFMPFFYQDASSSFFVDQQVAGLKNYLGGVLLFLSTGGSASLISNFEFYLGGTGKDLGPQYQFSNFYHPFVHYLIKILAQNGLPSVLSRPVQLTGDISDGTSSEAAGNLIHQAGYTDFDFAAKYSPAVSVNSPYAIEQIDFDHFSGYGPYNWEVFFHLVIISATQLSLNQQFEDADKFFKMVFDPTDSSANAAPQKFWQTKPFFQGASASIGLDTTILLYEADPAAQQAFWLSVDLWRNDPYDPHMLAQLRTNPSPYMYFTFMKYLDNIIAWAKMNYTKYTMESVNIAIQLYMMALETLGTKPVAIPPVAKVPVCNYYQLEYDLEALIAIDGPNGYLSDPIVLVENLIPPVTSSSTGTAPGGGASTGTNVQLPVLAGLYFCIPENKKLLSYWDKIETQLTKIRNCLNIEGQFQPLSPLPSGGGFGNLDGGGISDFGGVLPNYRFSVMIQKATELCNEVKSLGGSLLSSLEKQDAEGLALLHSTQEISVQQSIELVKQLQITDANLALENLQKYQSLLNDKVAYYTDLTKNGGLIPLEQQALVLNQFSLALEGPIEASTVLSSVLKLIPQFTLGASGFGGTPTVVAAFGGEQLGAIADANVQLMTFLSHFADKTAQLASTNAGYTRRLNEWNFQLTLANDELNQVASQIAAANNKIAIANQEEKNQQAIVDNAGQIDSFLKNKYTNQQLYTWMITQVSNVYFEAYQLAYNVAKQAEVCFGYELGITNSSYIKFGYWDSLHKGLLSGEALMSNIRQMDMDYLNFNIRENEITRNISLAQLNPIALLQLKSNRSCFFDIPEDLFDIDCAGDYFRRIKHLSITLPGVVGPYTPVSLRLTLLSNSVRTDILTSSPDAYPRHTDSSGMPTNDSRFLDNVASTQYMMTSSGLNDSGLFELNLRDERYLPFERAGAISSWHLEFTSIFPQLDPESITDLIIQLSYTSRPGGPAFENVVTQSLQKRLASALSAPSLVLMRGFSAKKDFPTQWYNFLNPLNSGGLQELDMDITRRFPYFTQGLTIKITSVVMLADIPAAQVSAGGGAPAIYLSGNRLSNQLINFGPDPQFGNMLYSIIPCKDSVGVWTISNGTAGGAAQITAADLNDLFVIFNYSLS